MKIGPLKEIIVLDRNHFPSPEDLARFASVIAGGKMMGLYWAEEVVFLYFLLPASTEVAAKALIEDGRAYWTLVADAPMPRYQPAIETKEKIIMPVINLSSSPTIRKVANWLKKQNKK